MADGPAVVHYKRAPYDVYIGRPSIWSNPFSHHPSARPPFRVASRQEAIRRYEAWLLDQPDLVERAKRELRGMVLGCWCAPLPCHGDVLLRIANENLNRRRGGRG
jgi:hypothetical protein